MKIYRVAIRRSGYDHDGFEYFSNKLNAEKRQRESNADVTGDDDFETQDEKTRSFTPDKVEILDFQSTKKGIISMLNQYCSYPDNG